MCLSLLLGHFLRGLLALVPKVNSHPLVRSRAAMCPAWSLTKNLLLSLWSFNYKILLSELQKHYQLQHCYYLNIEDDTVLLNDTVIISTLNVKDK